MRETLNFKLKKPDLTDPVDISVFNDNFEIIDNELSKSGSTAKYIIDAASVLRLDFAETESKSVDLTETVNAEELLAAANAGNMIRLKFLNADGAVVEIALNGRVDGNSYTLFTGIAENPFFASYSQFELGIRTVDGATKIGLEYHLNPMAEKGQAEDVIVKLDIINAKLNKLLDAGGYSKTKNETILAEVVLAENPEEPGVTVYQGSDKLGLVVGKTYTVHLDSGSYKTVCKDFGVGLLLGNSAIVGSDSLASDESFVICEMGADGQSICIIVDANKGKKASVSAITETIVPIDQKYLPGVCLPVVELSADTMTAIFTSGSANATAEEASMIISAKNALVPLCVRGNFNGMVFAVTASLSSDGNSTGYGADFGGTKLYFEITNNSVSISKQA